MQLVAYAYIWRDGDRNINILIGAFLIVTLSLNYFFEFVSNTDVVFLTLTGISFITNFSQKEFLVGDGVGDNPDS